MAAVKRQVTEEQKETVNTIPLNNEGFVDDYEEELPEIQIPSFLNKSEQEHEFLSEEEIQQRAVLNNVPNNSEAEELNHLNQLEEVAKNYSEKEWKRLLYYAPHGLMIEEIDRRMSAAEEYRKALISADEVMKRLKL